jgi:trans-aconitate methyltransferase
VESYSLEAETPNFDWLARVYRWMEYLSFGPMLQICRVRFLSQCSAARQALILGDGDGRFAARLLAMNSVVEARAIDSSGAMLAALQRRVQVLPFGAHARLSTTQADLRRWSPGDGGYDLIVSHFFLDCLTDDEVAALLERLRPYLAEKTVWLVSEFAVAKRSWQGAPSRLLIRGLYLAFSWMTGLRVQHLPDYGTALERHGFVRCQHASYLGGLLVSEVWERNAG